MTAEKIKNVLVTGASGKLGTELCRQLVGAGYGVRAMVHGKPVTVEGVQAFEGSVTDEERMKLAVEEMDAVCHLATVKGAPRWLDVSVKGTYNLLEAARKSGRVKRWILAGGDAAMGIWVRPQPVPINETMPHNAYPGPYSFSKVLEEVMGQQYYIMYGVPYVCLRASWIMDGNDFVRHMRVRGKSFGAPKWSKYLSPEQEKELPPGEERIPIGVKADGTPIVRHIVHVRDVAASFLLALERAKTAGQTYNIAAPEAFAYDEAAGLLSEKTGTPTLEVKIPEAHDFRIDIRKAREELGYEPEYDMARIIDEALKAGDEEGRPPRRKRRGTGT
ncbi:MAG: NAD-dependent epimerase/dehydratase family protein [Planctomycetota bacterium]|jgi:nucleoside-diphosphate-sugar epimerase